MKKIYLSLFLILCAIAVKAQNEFFIQANGGVSHYAGKSTVNSTFLDAGDPANHSGYPNGDGNTAAFSYGADLEWQYTFKCKFLLGLQAGYEVISSKTDINGVYDGSGGETPATGYVTGHYHSINLNPYIGYRFNLNKVKLDLLPGFDVAFGLKNTETVNVKANDNTYYNKPTNNYNSAGDEFRLRFGAAAYYKKFGITTSFSRGMNHFAEYADAYIPPEHMDVFRFGISYRIN